VSRAARQGRSLAGRGWFVGLKELLSFAEEFFSFGIVFGSGH